MQVPRAVLEQGRHVVAYASRTLSSSEKNCSVIQRECLAIIFALKQFRHYLLGCKFSLLTDHAPCSGFQVKKWRGCWQDGHWPSRSMILSLLIVKVVKIRMQMHYQGNLNSLIYKGFEAPPTSRQSNLPAVQFSFTSSQTSPYSRMVSSPLESFSTNLVTTPH